MNEPFGRYTLLERIAVGGMAEIFRAKAKGIGGFEKYFAIKRLNPRFTEDAGFISMLVDEARLTVELNHRNICQVFDLGRVEDHYYIAMEFINGRDLSQIARKMKDLVALISPDCAAFIAMEACAGLDYAHRKCGANGQPLGIVHRDVSPQNILLSFDGEVKIVDFGIAKAASRSEPSASGELTGKFFYMSPEQVRGEPLDHRTDIFSLGLVLYELLTGHSVYQEGDEATLFSRVRQAEIVPPSLLRADIPEALEKIVMKALAPNREDRYPSAQHMQQDLAVFLNEFSAISQPARISALMRELFGEPHFESESESSESSDYDLGEDDSESEDDEKTVIGHFPIPQEDKTGSIDAEGESIDEVEEMDEIEEIEESLDSTVSSPQVIRPTVEPVAKVVVAQQLEPVVQSAQSGSAEALASAFGPVRTPQPIQAQAAPLGRAPTPKPVQPARHFEPAVPNFAPVVAQRAPEPNIAARRVEVANRQTQELSAIHARRGSKDRLIIIGLVIAVIVCAALCAYLVFGNPEKSDETPIAENNAPGILSIESTPAGADVFIDGVAMSVGTPLKRELKSGQATHIRVALKGYKTFEETVTLAGGEARTIQAQLALATGTLTVKSTPSARLVVDGRVMGDTPQTLTDLALGAPISIKLEQSGYVTREAQLSFGDKTELTAEYVLDKEAPKAAPVPTVATRVSTNKPKPSNSGSSTKPSAPVAAPAPAPAAPTSGEDGFISVKAQEWGAVYVNGNRVANETPLVKHKVAPGTYRVYLCLQNDCGRRTATQTITVTSGKNTLVRF